MKPTGIIRPIDSMGRIVIPKEIRRHLNLVNEVDSVEIFVEGDTMLVKKYQVSCVFCGTLKDCITFNDRVVCKDCIAKLAEKKVDSDAKSEQ